MNAVRTLAAAFRGKSFRILGSVLLLTVMVLVFPHQKLLEAFTNIPASTFAAVIPIYLLLHLVGAVKWHTMVNHIGAKVPFVQAVQCYFTGLFANLFLPSVVGGDVVTISMGVSRAASTEAVVSGTLASRIIDLASLVLMAGLAALAFPYDVHGPSQRLLGWVLILFLAGALLMLAVFFFARRLREKIRGRLEPFLHAFTALWRQPGLLCFMLLLSLVSQTGLLLLTAWIGAGCGLDLPLQAWLFAWPLAKLSAFVPLTLAGIGARAFALAALLAPFGADPATAASAGLAWDGVMILGSLAAGGISKSLGLLPAAAARNRPCIQ